MRIINRYILREILVPFGLGLAVFTLILLIARILKLVEMVVNRGVPLLEVLKLFSYILPAFLEVTVPMALLLAVIVAFGRLSSDSEIVALKTSGVSLYQLMRPVALFAVVVYLVALALSLYARPVGQFAAAQRAVRDRQDTRQRRHQGEGVHAMTSRDWSSTWIASNHRATPCAAS